MRFAVISAKTHFYAQIKCDVAVIATSWGITFEVFENGRDRFPFSKTRNIVWRQED
jgi:hypothetical protein